MHELNETEKKIVSVVSSNPGIGTIEIVSKVVEHFLTQNKPYKNVSQSLDNLVEEGFLDEVVEGRSKISYYLSK